MPCRSIWTHLGGAYDRARGTSPTDCTHPERLVADSWDSPAANPRPASSTFLKAIVLSLLFLRMFPLV